VEAKIGTIAIHENPVWEAKSDFLILVDLERWGLSGRLEQLWVRRAGGNLVEVCCVPFFPYGIRLGDIVEIEVSSNGRHFFERVVKPSNRLNVRLVVDDTDRIEVIMPVISVILEDSGCEYEVFKPGYVAADVPTDSAERYLIRELGHLIESNQVTIEKV